MSGRIVICFLCDATHSDPYIKYRAPICQGGFSCCLLDAQLRTVLQKYIWFQIKLQFSRLLFKNTQILCKYTLTKRARSGRGRQHSGVFIWIWSGKLQFNLESDISGLPRSMPINVDQNPDIDRYWSPLESPDICINSLFLAPCISKWAMTICQVI